MTDKPLSMNPAVVASWATTQEGLMTNVVQLKRDPKAPHPADDLSFMKVRKPRGTGIDYWKIDVTGRYGSAYETGEKLAREYLTYIGQHPTVGNGTLLGCIVNDMVKRVGDDDRLSGVEIGFLSVINRAALFTAVYVPQMVRP